MRIGLTDSLVSDAVSRWSCPRLKISRTGRSGSSLTLFLWEWYSCFPFESLPARAIELEKRGLIQIHSDHPSIIRGELLES